MIAELFHWNNLADVLIVAAIIYFTISLFRGTVALQVLKGIAIVSILVALSNVFDFEMLTWIIERVTPVLLVGVIVLFQPELRRGLAKIGAGTFGKFSALESERVIDEVAMSAANLGERRHGAIIAFERETGLESFVETGTTLNAAIQHELLETIFFPKTLLHDGAVILKDGVVAAAGCILPLSYEEESRFGTRHRAAIGLSKETDAVVVIVSEETGRVSLAVAGKLVEGVSHNTLKEMLTLYVGAPTRSRR